jgi:antitoxin (DNA-binding transcriptional repressor) of toxin-antitoxin stability system
MGLMSIREFNSNISGVFAKVEAGETIEVTRNGKVIAEVRPKSANLLDDPAYRARYEQMLALMHAGIPGLTAASYDERTAR